MVPCDTSRNLKKWIMSMQDCLQGRCIKLKMGITKRRMSYSMNGQRAHQTRLDIEEIYSTMMSILVNTTHIECVKVALNILETFKTHFDDAKEMIRRIGVYEEFTFSVMSVMRTWENSDDELLALAKKVHGWGRIIAVEFLQPTTDEIKHWLMTDGSSNTLDNSYTSVACWKKSGAEDLLFGNPTKEEYKAIGSLIMLMFQSKAASRREKTDSIGNLDEILERFIEISPNYDLDVEDYEKLVYTLNAVRASAPESKLNDLLQNFLRSDDCVKKVRKALCDSLCAAERASRHGQEDRQSHDDPVIIMTVQDFLRTAQPGIDDDFILRYIHTDIHPAKLLLHGGAPVTFLVLQAPGPCKPAPVQCRSRGHQDRSQIRTV